MAFKSQTATKVIKNGIKPLACTCHWKQYYYVFTKITKYWVNRKVAHGITENAVFRIYRQAGFYEIEDNKISTGPFSEIAKNVI